MLQKRITVREIVGSLSILHNIAGNPEMYNRRSQNAARHDDWHADLGFTLKQRIKKCF